MALLRSTRIIVGICAVSVAALAITLCSGCSGYPMSTEKMVSMVETDEAKSIIEQGLVVQGDENDPANKELAKIGFGIVKDGVWETPVVDGDTAADDELLSIAVQQLTQSEAEAEEIRHSLLDEFDGGNWRDHYASQFKSSEFTSNDDLLRSCTPPRPFTSKQGDEYYLSVFTVCNPTTRDSLNVGLLRSPMPSGNVLDSKVVIWSYKPAGWTEDNVGDECKDSLAEFSGSSEEASTN